MTPDARYLLDAFRGSLALSIDVLHARVDWPEKFFLDEVAALVRAELLYWVPAAGVLVLNRDNVRLTERRAA